MFLHLEKNNETVLRQAFIKLKQNFSYEPSIEIMHEEQKSTSPSQPSSILSGKKKSGKKKQT